jgi:TIR domain
MFCVYSHQDLDLQQKLHTALAVLRRSGIITHHSDRHINSGMEWQHVIDQYLESADIILFLVSPDFLDSDYIYGKEMKRALERSRLGEVRAIPVILRYCDWKHSLVAHLQALPSSGIPITKFDDMDEGFQQVVEGVRVVALELKEKKESK